MSNTSARNKTSAPTVEPESLYAKHQKIYPREVHGLFAFWRAAGVFVLLGLFYIVPWLDWGGRQAVLLDLPERKFYIFGLTFWPQDFFYFAVLLIVAALSLFFFTALAGRMWCGYACPQTVWTELFLWIERKIEGDRSRQMKLAKAPWTPRKIAIKGSKQLVWLLLSAFTGFTFVGFFTPIRGLTENILHLGLGPWETFWIIFYSVATYGNAGFLREQVCLYMCPYARFQSAMFDKNTLIISYDPARGEPRGSRAKGVDYKAAGLGHCIDCTMCVQVCPTGIDIRNGLQYQCISCSACIDVCDDVMDKMNYPRGLIRYTTENALQGKKVHILRPRVIIYATILVLLLLSLGIAISQRVALELDVIRDRNSLYRETDDNGIENIYTLKIINMDEHAHEYTLDAQGIPGLHVSLDEGLRVGPGEVRELGVRVHVNEDTLHERSTKITFHLQAKDDPRLDAVKNARFMGPQPEREKTDEHHD
jgi:cytochrome c oxidase accessory protein FixG